MGRWGGLVLLGGLVVAACVGPTQQECADGFVCSADQVCAPIGAGCVDPAQVEACADGTAVDGTICTLGGIGAGTCVDGVCVVTGCGDGRVDLGEACDDGNDVNDDACTNACALPDCGDNVQQRAEACDDGAGNGDDRACLPTCVAASCGDGRVWAGSETCDAGAANVDDGACTTSCEIASCGDGHVWAGVETCDDGNAVSGDGCRADCGKVEVCGDAIVDASEGCDDGNGNTVDGCDACVVTAWSAEALLAGGKAALDQPLAFATDIAIGGAYLYVVDNARNRVYRVDLRNGLLDVVAGSGTAGFGGDGGPAASAHLSGPRGVAVDGLGNVFIADSNNSRIRRVDHASGTITTIATGVVAFGIGIDGGGNVYAADFIFQSVRRIDATTGAVTTVVGSGANGFGGDGGPALSAALASPRDVAVDPSGTLYIADTGNHRIRRVDPASGIITTVAGTGAEGSAGDGGPGTSATFNSLESVTVAAGKLLIADGNGDAVRRLDLATGLITGLTAVDNPGGVAVDRDGSVYYATSLAVWRIAPGAPVRIVGAAAAGGDTDGRPALAGAMNSPVGLAYDAAGNLYVAETGNQRVRRIDEATGTITTVAGNGTYDYSDDGVAAVAAGVPFPQAVAIDLDGALLVAEGTQRVRRVDPVTGVITTVAGTGAYSSTGDGGLATAATLAGACALAVDASGDLYIGEYGGHKIRRVAHTTGIITTFAGTGDAGAAGDGGAATAAQLDYPVALAIAGGALYVADAVTNRVRRIDLTTGIITTVVGTGVAGYAGDGGLATNATIKQPYGVGVTGVGDLVIADRGNCRVRRVAAATGVITTIAGTGTCLTSGDAGPATTAGFEAPHAVAIASNDDIVISGVSDGRIRRIEVATGRIITIAGAIDPPGVGPTALASLASPQALTPFADGYLVAGGAAGVIERLDGAGVSAVIGRWPDAVATTLARIQATFGSADGVAYDAMAGVIYLTETSANRLQVVTVVDPDDAMTWTITPWSGDTAGYLDGPLATARWREPAGLFFDDVARILYVADRGNHVVRAIDVDAQTVSTIAGTGATLGFFGDGGAATEALLFAPQAVTRCVATGDLYIADTANHRVRRVEAGTGVISTVLGDGVAASSGQGAPAWTFPVDAPMGVECDAAGNVYATSSTAVRLLPAAIGLDATTGVVDGSGPVQTIYGAAPRDAFPASTTSCLTAIIELDATTIWTTDACAGLLVELWRQPA